MLGMSIKDVKFFLTEEINSNSVYQSIRDEKTEALVNVFSEAIGKMIDENNKKLIKDFRENEIQEFMKLR